MPHPAFLPSLSPELAGVLASFLPTGSNGGSVILDGLTMISSNDHGRVAIFPSLGLAAMRTRRGGAWRSWVLAKALDAQAGRGWVLARDLRSFTKTVGVNERTSRRWLDEALNLRLMIEDREGERYFLIGAAGAAKILGVSQIGKRASIGLKALIRRNWRAHVWAAYLTGFERPISQDTKASLTGIAPRVQRNFQNGRIWRTKAGESFNDAIGSREINLAEHDGNPDNIEGLNEVTQLHFYEKDGKIIQRLPDKRDVPPEVSIRLGDGRRRKIQSKLNAGSFNEQRAKDSKARIFNANHCQSNTTLRRLAHSDAPPWARPLEVFELESQITPARGVNIYYVISV